MSEPSRYLDFLPGLYAKPENPLLGLYLKIFEKCLTGLDDDALDGRKGIQQLLSAEVIGNLFYPRFSFLFSSTGDSFIPPISGLTASEKTQVLTAFNSYIGVEAAASPLASYVTGKGGQTPAWQAAFIDWLNDFLVWLGAWVGLVVDRSWSIDKKRSVIAQILALYRLRGTAQGMSFLLNLLLDLPMRINGSHDVGGVRRAVTGEVAVQVLNPDPPPIRLTDQATRAGTFILRQSVQPGMPLISGYAPWLFLVRIVLPSVADPTFVLTGDSTKQIIALQKNLRTVLDASKPAVTHYRIELLPGMPLLPSGEASQLSVNSLLGTKVA